MRPLIPFRRRGTADPAPSRWAWRMQRLMLTPGFRLMLRAGLPFCAALAGGTLWLSDEANRALIRDNVAAARASIEQRPEFMVQMMAIDGADAALSEVIRTAVPLDFPLSSFDLNLAGIRATIASLDPVKSVDARIRPGGVLQIDVVPRVPVVLWRSADGLFLLDETGARVGTVSLRTDRPDLPIIAGTGASRHVPEALQLLAAAAPLGERLRGLVRMGDRRWDVVLDRNQRILLPETGAQRALDHVIALDAAKEVFARDVARVDMRLPDRPTLKMTPEATAEWRRIHKLTFSTE